MNSASTTGKDKEGRAREMIGYDIYKKSVSGVVIQLYDHVNLSAGVLMRVAVGLSMASLLVTGAQRCSPCNVLWDINHG
jgi:hypothetical protein